MDIPDGKFKVGDIICLKLLAERGEVEREEITGTRINDNGQLQYIADDIYLYAEDDIVSEIEGFDLAVAYHENQARMLREAGDEKKRKALKIS